MIKAVTYESQPHTVLARLQGARVPKAATVTISTITAALDAQNSLEDPNHLRPVETTAPFASDMAFDLPPHTVAVVEINETQ